MKSPVAARKTRKAGKPFWVEKVGSIAVPIYSHTNKIPARDPKTKAILFDVQPDGTKLSRVKYAHPIYTVAYYEGTRRIRLKFSSLDDAKREASLAAIKLANGETEALKLKGHDRGDYVRAMQKLQTWKPDANLGAAVNDYVDAVARLPQHVSLQEVINFYVKRHPIGLPNKTVREVMEEMVESKAKAGKSAVYIKDLNSRLGQFADAFQVGIAAVTGRAVEDYIRGLRTSNEHERLRRPLSGRTQNNVRRLICTLFKFAIRRGYLPKDHDEMEGVEKATVDAGEIEVFTPDELRKLFAACSAEVVERGKTRTREEMIPYLAIAAFCGLRAAEIERLDWAQIRLTGPERFIEVKAGNAKTASRRTVPISDNCARWLARFAKSSGPIISLARADKQLFIYLAEKSGVPWKHNGLRHSFISYRVAILNDVGRVSLEAGNSPTMIFKHYRQLVRESEANDWFSIAPVEPADLDVIPMPSGGPPIPPKQLSNAVQQSLVQ